MFLLTLTLTLYLIFLIISVSLSSSFYLWWALFFIIILSFGIAKVIGKNKALIFLPVLLITASFILSPFFSYDISFFGFLALISATFAMMLFLRQEIKNNENPEDRRSHPRLRESFAFNKSLAAVVMGVCFLAVFAIQENTELPFWIGLLGFFIIAYLISWEVFKFNFKSSRDVKFIAFISGFIAMEFAWALSFWPLGYFSNAMILLALNYAFISVIDAALQEKISSRKIAIDIGIALAAILIIAGTSRWLPL